MQFEHQEALLHNLGRQMIDEADSDNWEQVARLHQQLQDQLVRLFKSAQLPQDGRAAGLNYTHWRDGGYAFIVIGEQDPTVLRTVAEEARRQLSPV